MNRAMRREAERFAKLSSRPQRKRHTVQNNVPLLHEVEMVFGPIEAFLDQLATGEVTALASGEIIFSSPQGETYEAVPAVRGFSGALKRICGHFALPITDAPLVRLCNRLEACMPITPKDVYEARIQVEMFRQVYRKMDVSVVKGLVTTEMIAIELQQK